MKPQKHLLLIRFQNSFLIKSFSKNFYIKCQNETKRFIVLKMPLNCFTIHTEQKKLITFTCTNLAKKNHN